MLQVQRRAGSCCVRHADPPPTKTRYVLESNGLEELNRHDDATSFVYVGDSMAHATDVSSMEADCIE